MILKTFLTEKPPVACTKILGLIFSTGWCSCTQGARYPILKVLPAYRGNLNGRDTPLPIRKKISLPFSYFYQKLFHLLENKPIIAVVAVSVGSLLQLQPWAVLQQVKYNFRFRCSCGRQVQVEACLSQAFRIAAIAGCIISRSCQTSQFILRPLGFCKHVTFCSKCT